MPRDAETLWLHDRRWLATGVVEMSMSNQSNQPGGQFGSPRDTDRKGFPYNQEIEFALWEKYEAIAMHFNDLIMRLRTQALGGLAGVVAISGVAINLTAKPETKIEWGILFGTICFFLVAWLALWVLDWFYYTRLLLGAVDAIKSREDLTEGRITLSTRVEARVGRYWIPINFFYGVVMLALVVGAIFTGCSYFHTQESAQAETKGNEYKLNLSPDQDVKIEVVPKSKSAVTNPPDKQTSPAATATVPSTK